MILIVGEFGTTDYLLHEVRRSVPNELSSKVHCPADAYSAVVKGTITTGIKGHFSSLNNKVRSIPPQRDLVTRSAVYSYCIEVQEAFRRGIDPEYYRVRSAAGSSLCKFVAKKIIGKGEPQSADSPIKLSLQQSLSPGQPLEFSHRLYVSDDDLQYTEDPGKYPQYTKDPSMYHNLPLP